VGWLWAWAGGIVIQAPGLLIRVVPPGPAPRSVVLLAWLSGNALLMGVTMQLRTIAPFATWFMRLLFGAGAFLSLLRAACMAVLPPGAPILTLPLGWRSSTVLVGGGGIPPEINHKAERKHCRL